MARTKQTKDAQEDFLTGKVPDEAPIKFGKKDKKKGKKRLAALFGGKKKKVEDTDEDGE